MEWRLSVQEVQGVAEREREGERQSETKREREREKEEMRKFRDDDRC